MLYIGSSKANSAFKVSNSIHIFINYSINSSCYYCFNCNSPVLHCEIFMISQDVLKSMMATSFPFSSYVCLLVLYLNVFLFDM